MRVRVVAVLGAVVMSGPAMAGPQQFDLICKGVDQPRIDGPKAPYEHRYRIDLAANRWCVDGCEGGVNIKSVTADQLVFADEEDRSITHRHSIDRTTGKQWRLDSDRDGLWRAEQGHCDPAPFSGMPAPKF